MTNRSVKARKPNPRLTLILSGFILLSLVISILFHSRLVNYGLIIIWLLVLGLPTYANMRFVIAARTNDVTEIVCWITWLHRLLPWAGWSDARYMYQATALIHNGELTQALELLTHAQVREGWMQQWVQTHMYVLRNEWSAVLSMLNQVVVDRADVQLAFGSLRVRALAETNQWDACLETLDALSHWNEMMHVHTVGLSICALAGKPSYVQQIIHHYGDRYEQSIQDYWLAVAHVRAREYDQARLLFDRVAQSSDPLLQAQIQYRLAQSQIPQLNIHTEAHLERLTAIWRNDKVHHGS